MDVPHKLKLLLAGMIAAAPLTAGAQGVATSVDSASLTLAAGGQIAVTDSGAGIFAQSVGGGGPGGVAVALPTSGATLALGANRLIANSGTLSLTLASSTGTPSTGALNLLNFSPGIGTLQIGPGTGLTLGQLQGISIDPTLSIGTTINYSFGVASQPTTDSPEFSLNELHALVAHGSPSGAVNPGDFANSAPGNQGISVSDVSVVPEPGVVALLALGGLGFATRLRAKRR